MRTLKYVTIITVFLVSIMIISCNDTDNPTAPSPPRAQTPSPADGATDVAIDTDLTWNGTFAYGTTATVYTYDVYFGTTSPPPKVASDISATTYDPGTLIETATYYWRIDTKGDGQTTTGDVWSFSTIVGTDEIIIGTRDDHINLPFCGGCYIASRNQELILATEMNGAATIIDLAYEYQDVTGTEDGTFDGFKMYLCHTSVSELGDNYEDNYTSNTPVLVASADPVTLSNSVNTWVSVPGFGSFDYNGTDNLIIEIVWTDSNGVSFETYCSHDTVTRNLHAAVHDAATGNQSDHVLRKKLTTQ